MIVLPHHREHLEQHLLGEQPLYCQWQRLELLPGLRRTQSDRELVLDQARVDSQAFIVLFHEGDQVRRRVDAWNGRAGRDVVCNEVLGVDAGSNAEQHIHIGAFMRQIGIIGVTDRVDAGDRIRVVAAGFESENLSLTGQRADIATGLDIEGPGTAEHETGNYRTNCGNDEISAIRDISPGDKLRDIGIAQVLALEGEIEDVLSGLDQGRLVDGNLQQILVETSLRLPRRHSRSVDDTACQTIDAHRLRIVGMQRRLAMINQGTGRQVSVEFAGPAS